MDNLGETNVITKVLVKGKPESKKIIDEESRG